MAGAPAPLLVSICMCILGLMCCESLADSRPVHHETRRRAGSGSCCFLCDVFSVFLGSSGLTRILEWSLHACGSQWLSYHVSVNFFASRMTQMGDEKVERFWDPTRMLGCPVHSLSSLF